MDVLHARQVMRAQGRDHQLPEKSRLGMEEREQMRDRKAAAGALLGRLAKLLLQSRRIGHRTP
jgi:hypothetical protein